MEPMDCKEGDFSRANKGEILWIDAQSKWRTGLPYRAPHARVKVLQYNILAECYARPQWFLQVKPENLHFASRSKLILRQIAHSTADVVCMQEVDRFESFWKPQMSQMGYDVFYAQRPQKEDGCAIFYKRDLFKLDRSKIVNYEDPFLRVAAIVALSSRGDHTAFGLPFPFRFVVATTHLHWDDSQQHVQSAEVATLLRSIVDFNNNNSQSDSDSDSDSESSFVILTGDFNFQPDTAMYTSIKSGLADSGAAIAPPYRFTHTYGLNSLPEPEFSAFTTKHYYWIDYIWYCDPRAEANKKSSLKWGVERTVVLPSRAAVSCEDGGLPNSTFGSDHIAIGAEFGLLDLTKPHTYD